MTPIKTKGQPELPYAATLDQRFALRLSSSMVRN